MTMAAYCPPAGAFSGTEIVNGTSVVSLGARVPDGSGKETHLVISVRRVSVRRSALYDSSTMV